MLAPAQPSMLTRYHFRSAAFNLVDEAVRDADSYADLVERLEVASPFIRYQLKGTSLVRVASPLLIGIAYIITWEITDYVLHWSNNAIGLACFASVLLAGYLTRYFATIPVSSFR